MTPDRALTLSPTKACRWKPPDATAHLQWCYEEEGQPFPSRITLVIRRPEGEYSRDYVVVEQAIPFIDSDEMPEEPEDPRCPVEWWLKLFIYILILLLMAMALAWLGIDIYREVHAR